MDVELASHSASVSTIYRSKPFAEVGGYREELGPWADTFAARAVGLKHGAVYVSYSQMSGDHPWRTIDVIARAAHLMRSYEFRDRFPEEHVRRWERQFRRLIAWNHFLNSNRQPRRNRLIRSLQRLPKALTCLGLLAYRGDISCYENA